MRGVFSIKPVIGDDYQAVLRQMRLNESKVLFAGSYNGVGATRELFVRTMATANLVLIR